MCALANGEACWCATLTTHCTHSLVCLPVEVLYTLTTIHCTVALCLQRDQVHQREVLVSSLQQQLRKVTEMQAAKQHQQQDKEGGNLVQETAKLKDSNARLEEELQRMKERNRELEEVGKALLWLLVII